MAESSLHLKVMLVDDHHLVRFALRALLEKHGCEIVAEADSADSALKLVASSRPQIVLMDLEMPGTDGITATRHLKRAVPDVKVIFLSAHDEEKDVIEALTEAGAAGYVLKSDVPEELPNALRAVSSGKRYLSPSVAPLLLTDARQQSQAKRRRRSCTDHPRM
jgi:two-component system invasion response regulator UvrY